jgi:hypothetical protein
MNSVQSSPTLSPQMAIAIIPKHADVICGRGAGSAHPGTRLYRSIVRARKIEYLGGDDVVKKRIAEEVLSLVTANEGRFLKFEGNRYVVMTEGVVLSTIKQAIRDSRDPDPAEHQASGPSTPTLQGLAENGTARLFVTPHESQADVLELEDRRPGLPHGSLSYHYHYHYHIPKPLKVKKVQSYD